MRDIAGVNYSQTKLLFCIAKKIIDEAVINKIDHIDLIKINIAKRYTMELSFKLSSIVDAKQLDRRIFHLH